MNRLGSKLQLTTRTCTVGGVVMIWKWIVALYFAYKLLDLDAYHLFVSFVSGCSYMIWFSKFLSNIKLFFWKIFIILTSNWISTISWIRVCFGRTDAACPSQIFRSICRYSPWSVNEWDYEPKAKFHDNTPSQQLAGRHLWRQRLACGGEPLLGVVPASLPSLSYPSDWYHLSRTDYSSQ